MGELAGWTFCPRCRTELRGDAQRLECPECGFVAYASSKPTAGALVEDDEGRLLLVRRAHEPFKGRWDIPGGFLEEGEHPLDGLRRELREETGLDVELVDVLGVYSDPARDPRGHTVSTVFVGRATGAPRGGDDAAEAGVFTDATLPASIVFDHPMILADYFRYRRTGARPRPAPPRG